MYIINQKKLSKNPSRSKALLIAEAGYQAIDIEKATSAKCQVLSVQGNEFLNIKLSNNKKEERIKLSNFKKISIIGIGKGSALASATLSEILGDRLTEGIALDVCKPELKIKNSKLKILIGTHPLPSKQNVVATKKIIKLVKSLDKNNLLIVFICGGGSALLCGSEKELVHSKNVFNKLTGVGVSIQELNIVRKHLSEVKGGRLVKIAYPATVVSLIVSDVFGNDLSTIASGPTVFDKTTNKDAKKVLNKYLCKSKYLSVLINDLRETPKDKKYFKKVKNILFVCNQDAVLAMAEKAEKLGFSSYVYSLELNGEAKKSLFPMVKKVKSGEVILAGGETTVILEEEKGKSKKEKLGKGGRSQEAVLGVMVSSLNRRVHQIATLNLSHDLVVISFASDGRDNTEAAGAIADILTVKKAKELKLNSQKFLDNHNSFNFFKKTGDLIFAEQKSFNVSDLMVVLKI